MPKLQTDTACVVEIGGTKTTDSLKLQTDAAFFGGQLDC